MNALVSQTSIDALSRVLASVGWEVKFADANVSTGRVDVRFSRNDGRWLHVRRDEIGRTTVETWHRYIAEARASRRAASSDRVDDMFMGRREAEGIRSALRHVCGYIESNPAPALGPCSRYEIRRALAPLIPAG